MAVVDVFRLLIMMIMKTWPPALSLLLLHLQLYIQPSEANSPRRVILPDDGCNCDRTFILPVCSNSSFTYGNECQLNCESQARVKRGQTPIVVQYTGICKREGCICPTAVIPVCGSDDNTYENECRLSCESDRQVRLGLDPIYLKSQEECPSSCNCPIDIIPSCGSDGVTYSSQCLIRCENVKRARLGLPPILRTPGACPAAQCICPQYIYPVCGTDDRTYSNECQLVCESNRRQSLGLSAIKVKNQGRCPSVPCICSYIILPVCGSNGRTYDNECLLNCASKNQQNNGGPPIFLAYRGSCKSPICQCPVTFQPVCGTDRLTYRNVCYLNCASFNNIQSGGSAIFLSRIGRC
ncbi:hypothetical protein MSG28_001331 [Choristoneura fumiferana]|uniref:Uncharacterized protein n=1 Tax=Choristoneura fumiferana TaxID=7141 RepID=A0ACC0KUL8_CHOFU|nr:hypothetical protein MSG28_001331 [Choristoneura fumiferana]